MGLLPVSDPLQHYGNQCGQMKSDRGGSLASVIREQAAKVELCRGKCAAAQGIMIVRLFRTRCHEAAGECGNGR